MKLRNGLLYSLYGYILLHGLLWWNLHQYVYSPRSLIPSSWLLWGEKQFEVTCCESKNDFDFLVSLAVSIPMLLALWHFSRQPARNVSIRPNACQRFLERFIFWTAWLMIHFFMGYSLFELTSTYPFSMFGLHPQSHPLHSKWFEFCCGPESNRYSLWFCLVLVTPATMLLWSLRKQHIRP